MYKVYKWVGYLVHKVPKLGGILGVQSFQSGWDIRCTKFISGWEFRCTKFHKWVGY